MTTIRFALAFRANDPVRTRLRDEAAARRCYVEQEAAAARRIRYGVMANGTVEFASVNLHDNMNIPD